MLFVIGLYPGLVPEEYRSRVQYPAQVPQLTGSQLEEALQALIHFLLQIRHRLVGCSENTQFPGAKSSPTIKSRQQMLQIVDTTLLKCYLKTNDTLVPSLLRMPDSRVSVEEGERVLRQAHKYSDVVLLLKTRGQHHRALQLLHRHSKRQDSPLHGPSSTITYLQHLGMNHIELIFEYGGWVIKSDPEEGLKIFIGDDSTTGEVEQLPRPRVLNFLKKTEKSLVVPYLEHVIWEWGDKNPLLHNELIHQYREAVMTPLPSADSEPSVIEESKAARDEVREKLLNFLKSSCNYTAATILAHFPHDSLYKERALLLGRLGQHQQALNIYVHVLNDLESAVQHCHSHYNPSGRDSEVYLILLKLLVIPNSSTDVGDGSPLKDERSDKSSAVLELLQSYAQFIDIEQAIKVLPDNLNLHLLKTFLHSSLSGNLMNHHRKQIERGLTKSILVEVCNTAHFKVIAL